MLKSALSVFLFCFLGRLDCKDLTAKRGENATLECFGSKYATEVMIQWKKTHSTSEVNVILFKDGKFHHFQDDSFKGRVNLTDPNWKETKDFTVNLKYVIMNDTGIYQCKAGYGGNVKVLNATKLTVISNHTSITAFSGENILLPCHNPNNDLILAVRWSRPDLEPKHVVSYQEGEFDPEDQHPSFKNRVGLEGRKMKDGDVSLILKDLTVNDTGTYECRVVWKGTRHMKRADLEADPISVINLIVSQGQTGGPKKGVGLMVGLSVSAVVLVGVVVGLSIYIYIYRRRTQLRQHFYQCPAEKQQIEMDQLAS